MKKTFSDHSKDIVDQLKLTESYTSLLLGLGVVIVGSILFISFVKTTHIFNRPQKQEVSSQKTENVAKADTMSVSYIVQEGDDVKSIALKFYNNEDKWQNIVKDNNIQNPDLIEVGVKLVLKDVPTQKTQPTSLPTQVMQQDNNRITGDTYTVKENELLWDIAVRAYGDGFRWADIVQANNLQNPDNIPAGTVLKIPR